MSALIVCNSELPQAEVVELRTHPHTVIRDALREHCRGIGLGEAVHTQAVIDTALAARTVMGASVAMSIVEGKRTATAIKHKLDSIAHRFPRRLTIEGECAAVDAAFRDGSDAA